MSDTIFKRIDHLAIAVRDLEKAISHYRDILGMAMLERRETKGKSTGMLSAVMDAGSFAIVLVQGTEEESQVSRYISSYGQGVQHVAFEVDNIEDIKTELSNKGVAFATDLLEGPGLKQIFTQRDPESGMMYEFIERTGEEGFQDNNVNRLFEHLEEKGYI